MNNDKKKILAIDCGFSSLKISEKDSYGAIRMERIINAVAQLPEAPLETDDKDVFSFLGEYYCLGPTALKVPREYIIEVNDWDSLKKVYPVWISYLVKKYGGDQGFEAFDKIVIGLSLAFMNKGDEILEHLYDTLLFNSERRDLFVVLPQATAARVVYEKYGTALRDTDQANRNATKLKNYIIDDIGFYSQDIVSVLNSRSSAGGNVGVENSGVIVICYKLVDYIYKNFNGLKISLKEAMSILENKNFIRRRVTYDMKDVVDQFSKEFIRDTLNLLEEKMASTLDNAEAVLIIGGGAHIFSNFKDDPDVIAEIEKHFPKEFLTYPEADSEHYNARSYLMIVDDLLNQGKI